MICNSKIIRTLQRFLGGAGRLDQEKSKSREQPTNVYAVYSAIIKAQTERGVLR